MKKWGRKKTSLFARVFSGSWFSKLMPKVGSFETDSVKNKHRSEMGYPTRFYSLDEDDAYWRMSFAEERIQQGRRSTGGINPLWHDHTTTSDDHGFHLPKETRRDECLNFNDMVLDVRMTKERQNKKKNLTAYEDFSEETMKKSRMKWKKKGRDDTAMEYSDTIFDSFAVVKTSSDPHGDFRDSMVDMIREEGITRPKELEELLSCYLTLNSHEYHDLIIKVFQDVWLEINGGCISSSNGQRSIFR